MVSRGGGVILAVKGGSIFSLDNRMMHFCWVFRAYYPDRYANIRPTLTTKSALSTLIVVPLRTLSPSKKGQRMPRSKLLTAPLEAFISREEARTGQNRSEIIRHILMNSKEYVADQRAERDPRRIKERLENEEAQREAEYAAQHEARTFPYGKCKHGWRLTEHGTSACPTCEVKTKE